MSPNPVSVTSVLAKGMDVLRKDLSMTQRDVICIQGEKPQAKPTLVTPPPRPSSSQTKQHFAKAPLAVQHL